MEDAFGVEMAEPVPGPSVEGGAAGEGAGAARRRARELP
jgi:hypothetical protein